MHVYFLQFDHQRDGRIELQTLIDGICLTIRSQSFDLRAN